MNNPLLSTANIQPASLEDPLYYLHNLDSVLTWVLSQHRDIFSASELAQIHTILSLEQASRACLYRLIMRRGQWFRDDKLNYREIGEIRPHLKALSRHQLIQYDEPCQLTELLNVCLVSELQQIWQALASGQPPKGKDALLIELSHFDSGAKVAINEWWPEAGFKLIKICCQDLFDTMTTLFFGNSHQDWSEFVLTELGHQRYQQVDLHPQHRPFKKREELNTFMLMSRLNDALFNRQITTAEAYDLLPTPLEQDWLEYRRQKLLFRIAHAEERAGKYSEALNLYRQCQYREAKIRQMRVMEKLCNDRVVFRYATLIKRHARREDWREAAIKIEQRSAKKCGIPVPKIKRWKPNLQHLVAIKIPNQSVEYTVKEHFHRPETPCYYVENALFPGLFALTFWEAIFAPIEGAFFNPFQRQPADLYQSDFSSRRQDLIDMAWQQMQQADYRDLVIDRYRDKKGIANPFAIWGHLNEELLCHALQCIPIGDLKVVFDVMWQDLRQYKNGFPDLIRFDLVSSSYQLIEVKGPGDKLQDHQLRWLRKFADHGIDAVVCHVSWQ